MNTHRVWTAVLLACLVHSQAAGQTVPPKVEPVRPTQPTIPASSLPQAPVVKAGEVQVTNPSAGVMHIQTNKPNNIVNWNSFNIGQDATVKIGQPNSSAVLLNNIVGRSPNPTVINGILKNIEGQSSGRVYFYDPAGIVFGAGARVNLNSLIASTLRFDEARLKAGGLLMPGTDAALRAALDDVPDGVRPGSILVENGARIAVDNGGQLMLAAPGVYNAGELYAPDGQVILAAGDKVYLASPDVASTGTKLRGLVVEVQNATGKASTADNTGVISVDRGNASMVGYAVNQMGTVSAKTSVNLNGSIYLKALDTAQVDAAQSKKDAAKSFSSSGTVKLGAASVTEILPDDKDDKTLTLANLKQFNKSEVQIFGQNISLQGDGPGQGAQILAKGGLVDLQSVSLPANTAIYLTEDVVRVTLGQGSLIDVSGMNTAKLGMASNIISVDLRGNELADNVLLRDSPMYGKKINVDIRKGTGIANIDGWLKLVENKLDQVNTEGGSITINSQGAVIQQPNSLLRLDGGGVTYEAGHANASRLKLGNSVVDVSAAKAGLVYTQVINAPNGPANFEQGYYQGSKAGSLNISAQVVGLGGDMSATTNPGFYQRNVSQAASKEPYTKLVAPYPTGGNFALTVLGIGQTRDGDAVPTLRVGNAPAIADLFDDLAPLSLDNVDSLTQMAMDINSLSSKGFRNFNTKLSGNIWVDTPLNLPARSSLNLSAETYGDARTTGNLNVNAPISAPGGSVTLSATNLLAVAPGKSISTAGRWTNDALSRVDPLTYNVATNAGNISLTGHQIKLGDAAALEASAGAWLDEFGKIRYGNPGTISLIRKFNAGGNSEGNNFSGIQIGAGVNLSAFGFSTGGQLVLRDNLVNIASAATLTDTDRASLQAAGGLLLDPAFFSQGGFSGFEINSLKDTQLMGSGDMTIWSSAQIKPTPLSLALTASASRTPTGNITTASQLTTLPLASNGAVRPSSSLSLIAGRKLSMASGTTIAADPQSVVNLLANDQLTVLGSVAAPAGRIVLGLTSTDGFDPSRGIWLGAASVLNAAGSAQRIFTDSRGVSRGELLDGGLIQLGQAEMDTNRLAASVRNFSSANGFIVAEKGATLNADGLGPLNFNLQTMSGVVKTSVASNAGTIDIRSSLGMLIAAGLSAKASPVARGGTLNLVLDNSFATPDDPFSATLENPDTLNEYPRILNLLVDKSKTTVVPTELVAGAAFFTQQDSGAWYLTGSSLRGNTTRNAGEAWVQTSAVAGGGFGRLQFKSRGTISFNLADGANTLSARDAIVLDAPILLADRYKTMLPSDLPPQQLGISAPYVQIGGQTDPIMGFTDENTKQPAFYADQKPFMTPEPSYGWASMVVNATYLDLAGTTSLKGYSKANLNSLADTRVYSSNGFYPEFRDQPFINANPDYLQYLPGQFFMVGELVLNNAQIYPGSLSQFRIDVLDNNPSQLGSLKFQSNGQTPNQVYSSGGAFTAVASNIVQAGVVKAPLGNMTLGESGKTRSLVYAAGSLTSVKGEAEMLYGNIENGSVPTASSWRVSGNNGSGVDATLLLKDANPSNLYRRNLPSKQIFSLASDIDVQTGAVLNASKGGKLLAYEFTPGKQGSSDVLNVSNTYAILPGFQGSVAPVDPNNPDDTMRVGDRVYLSAGAGLAAGTYTLLPAHYALLPGGFSVKVNPNSLGMTSQDNQVLPDGTALVSGSLLAASQTKGTLRGFQLMSGAVIQKKSEFNIKDAEQYFTEQAAIRLLPLPELPSDAGYMRLLAGNNTTSDGQLRLNGQVQMVGGSMDISVLKNEIRLVDSNSSGLANVLTVGNLNQMQISSLLVGGVRETIRDGTGATAFGISKLTKNVSLNNPDSVLRASDLMLVAEETLQIDAAAGLSVTAAPKFDVAKLSLAGDAALLRVTGGSDIQVERTTTPAFAKGQLNIQAGARITTIGSAYLDATKGMDLADWTPSVGNQGLLGFAARGIHVVDTIAEPSINGPQLQLQAAQLLVLNKPGQRLSLNSYDRAIGFASNFALGTASDEDQGIASLAIRSAGLQALADNINVSVRAQNVSLQGLSVVASTDEALKQDTALSIDSQQLTVGDGVFALGGFKSASLTASSLIKGSGDQGFLVAFGDLSMTANVFSTDSGKALRVVSKGDLTLGGGANLPSEVTSIGGELSFTAAKILANANISLPSGLLTFNHADDQQNINVAAGSLEINGGIFNLSGARQYFGQDAQGNDLWADAPGGSMAFNAASLALYGGTFDVSAMGAAAGALSFLTSAQTASPFTWFDAIVLRGGASEGQSQGQFSLSTNTIDNFSALNNKVRTAGFTESLSYRQTSGDLVIAEYLDGVGDLLKARSITLTADQGSIDIAGTLDASGPKGGNIAIYAAQANADEGSGNIVLRNTAVLNASSTALTAEAAGSPGRGGSVLLSASTWDGSAPSSNSMASGSFVDLQGGLINTTGGLVDGEGLRLALKDGTVLVRVPRTAGNLNAAINSVVGTQFVGAKPTLEAFSVYARSEVNAADFSSDIANASSFYSQAKSYIDNVPSALAVFNVRAGVEIRSAAGDMSLSVNELDPDASLRGLDLSTWRFNGQPINLTLRAAGDLTIRGSISDGFVNPNTKPTYNPYLPNADDGVDRRGMAMPNWALGTGPSADINLVAGADFNSANPMATLALSSFVSSNKGNFTLGFADRRAYTEEELLISDPLTPPITINDMPVALVRTGTGNINLAAARDVTLELLRLETLLDSNENQKILVYANQTKPFSDSRSLKHSVMLVGASIYTAGEIDSEAYDAGIRANIPHNVLNPHYLGSAIKNQTSPAMFAKNGGAISIRAGRHIQGPVRKGGSGSYQNGDYDLPIEFDVETFYLYDYLPESLDDFDLATSTQLAKALGLATADADSIIDELRADTDYQSGAIKTLWAYDAYIPVLVTESGDTYADDYVLISDMIYDDADLQTSFDQKLDLLKSGKLTQAAAKKTLGELTDIIQKGVKLAETEATRLAAELLAEYPDDYSKTGMGELLDTAVIVTAFLNDEHFTTRDWAPTGVSPLVNNWLFRQGRSNTNASGQAEFVQLPCKPLNCSKPSLTTAWFARPDYFNQSMATLGGGDLNIKAGGAVRDIYASTASNAYMTGGSQAWTLKEQGGGDLKMSAGGDIAGAAIYVQKGTATVSTQSSIVAGDNLVLRGDSQRIATYDVNKPVDARVPMGTIFAMGDAQLEVTARKNLTLAAVYNPTLTEQSKYNRSGSITPADYIKDLPNFNENSLLTGLYPVLKYPFYPKYQDANYWNPANDPAIAGTNVFTDFDQFQQNFSQYASFSTYTPASSLKLLAMTGATALVNDAELVAFSGGEMLTNELVTGFANLGLDRPYTAAPSQVKAVAMSGGLRTQNGFAMMPSTNPRLNLWAQGDITLNNGSAGSIHAIDVKAESLSSVSAPRVPTDLDISLIRDSYVNGATAHAEAYAEAANPDAIGTSSIVSLRDVVGDSQFAQYSLNLARPASIIAGRDILSLGFVIQNLKSDDLSMVKAGRDLRDETRAAIDCTETNNASICVQHVVTGPGTLLVTAGRDIDLGNQAGIVTRGNLDNPYLPEGGASIQLTTAGLKPDHAALKAYTQKFNQPEPLQEFVAVYLNKLGITDRQPSDTELDALQGLVTADLKALESSKLTDKERIALYFRMLDSASYLLEPGVLSDSAQNQLLIKAMSNARKLKHDDSNQLSLALFSTASKLTPQNLSGTEQNKLFIEILNNASLLKKADSTLDLTDFDGLIASLFPGLNGDTPVGNLSSHSSQVKTEQGGSIDIFAPTGSVYAGLTMGKPGSKPSNQGLFTVRGGDINALVKNDFLVNQGRVFTLGGGDITLVSQFGNLEAGKGAKTASSAPPPLIVIGKDGSITVDVSGSVAGSGIATLSTKPGQPISDVNTVAPRGYVDAGDAGIQSTGNVNINSPQVRNADNIAASSGVSNAQAPAVVAAPAAPPPPPPAASNAGDDAKKSLANTNTGTALANLSVELLGFGDVSAGTAGQSGGGSSTSGSGKDEKDKDEKSQENNPAAVQPV